jgi:hypothetical protein
MTFAVLSMIALLSILYPIPEIVNLFQCTAMHEQELQRAERHSCPTCVPRAALAAVRREQYYSTAVRLPTYSTDLHGV